MGQCYNIILMHTSEQVQINRTCCFHFFDVFGSSIRIYFDVRLCVCMCFCLLLYLVSLKVVIITNLEQKQKSA